MKLSRILCPVATWKLRIRHYIRSHLQRPKKQREPSYQANCRCSDITPTPDPEAVRDREKTQGAIMETVTANIYMAWRCPFCTVLNEMEGEKTDDTCYYCLNRVDLITPRPIWTPPSDPRIERIGQLTEELLERKDKETPSLPMAPQTQKKDSIEGLDGDHDTKDQQEDVA